MGLQGQRVKCLDLGVQLAGEQGNSGAPLRVGASET